MSGLIWGFTAAFAGIVIGMLLRALPPPIPGAPVVPVLGGPLATYGRRIAGWIAVISLVGTGITIAPVTPLWMGGTALAAGYVALAFAVVRRAVGGRTGSGLTERLVADRFEQIVAPLRNEMPT